MTTVYDVARVAGVSTATVSHVINKTKRFSPATTTRVQSAIAELKFETKPVRRVPSRPDTIPMSSPSELNDAFESSIVVNSGDLPTARVHSAVYSSQKRDALKPITAASATMRAMLRIVRAAQPISRADLARRLAVRRSMITELVKPLMASGLLHEGVPEQMRSRIGRPPVGLSLRDESTFFIGVNIGIRRTQVGAALLDGQMLAEESYDTPSDSGVTLAQVRASIDRLRTSISDRTISAIGVTVPGPADAERKRLLFAPHLGWRNVEIAKDLRLENKLRARRSNPEVPIIVENDATAAAMYELRRRLRNSNNREPGDFVLVRAGTGIGVGLVIGGEIYQGSGTDGGLLGEFGHMTIVAGGKPCVCGNRGCWERYASASSAASLYAGDRRQTRDGGALRFVDIVARAEAGERRAQVTLERIGDYLGIGIANIISALGIARIVLSGRLVFGWKFIEASLHESVARTMVGRLATWTIQPGEPSGAGLGGALEVVIEQHLNAIVAEMRSAA